MTTDKTYFLKSNENLYRETLKEFSSFSFDVASLNTIIKNSEFNKGSFYYRFNDKLDLYLALFYDIIVKQYDAISKLKSIILNDNTLETYLNILFESQYDLFCENPLFISFIRNFYNESLDFKNSIISMSESPLIDVFLNILKKEYLCKLMLKPDDIQFLVYQIELTYYNYDSYLKTNSKDYFSDKIVNFLLSGINKNIIIKDESLKYDSNNFLINKSLIYDVLLENKTNEIISIIGPKSSGKSFFISTVYERLNSYNIEKPFDYKLKKSLLWNLKRNSKIKQIDQDFTKYINDLSIKIDYHKRLDLLKKSDQKYIELYLRFLFNNSFIVIDDLFDFSSEEEISIVSSYLKKWKQLGYLIILSSRKLENVSEISDRVGFISNGHLINIKTVYELLNKYGKITHIIKYFDNNLIKIAAFSNESFNIDYFNKIVKNHKIFSFETRTALSDEIFKIETGVNLG